MIGNRFNPNHNYHVDSVKIKITESEVKASIKRAYAQSKERAYCHERGNWSGGSCGPRRPFYCTDMPCKSYTVFMGLMGEHAAVKYINKHADPTPKLKVDLEPHENGDGDIDLLVNGWKIQIKATGYKGKKEIIGFVRCENEFGTDLKITSDLFIFSWFDYEDPYHAFLLGWVDVKEDKIEALEPHAPRALNGGGWKNLEVPRSRFRVMSQLIYMIRGEKRANGIVSVPGF